jgi:hypothetical protein
MLFFCSENWNNKRRWSRCGMKGDRGTEYLWIGYKKCKEFLKEEAI